MFHRIKDSIRKLIVIVQNVTDIFAIIEERNRQMNKALSDLQTAVAGLQTIAAKVVAVLTSNGSISAVDAETIVSNINDVVTSLSNALGTSTPVPTTTAAPTPVV